MFFIFVFEHKAYASNYIINRKSRYKVSKTVANGEKLKRGWPLFQRE